VTDAIVRTIKLFRKCSQNTSLHIIIFLVLMMICYFIKALNKLIKHYY